MARALVRAWHCAHDLIDVLAAARPGCFPADSALHRTTHGLSFDRGPRRHPRHDYTLGGIVRCMRTIIVVGVAGGMSAATRLRRLDEQRDILVLERGNYVSFANCGLPYHVGGVIEDRSALLLQTPESLSSRFALDVRVRHEVVAINAAAKIVTVRDLDAGAGFRGGL